MDMKKAQEEFLNYTESYRELGSSCLLKIHHTFRVMKLCERIAKSLHLSEEDIEVAKMCGLLHDIGRFEQWKNFQTFNDAKSIDHANLGVAILEKNDYWQKYFTDSSIKDTIFNSIRYHNKFEVSKDLSLKDKMFCNIVRDADKIDILYLYTVSEIHVDTKNESFSPRIYQDLLEGNQIKRENRKNSADLLSISLGFIFDINYPESFKILREKNYINQEIDLYQKTTDNKLMREQLEQVRQKIKTYKKG